VLLSEFGGIAYRKGGQQGWGYSTAADDAEFIRRFRDRPRAQVPAGAGLLRPRIGDVEQEINSLSAMTASRG
jgi:hypothetical protein